MQQVTDGQELPAWEPCVKGYYAKGFYRTVEVAVVRQDNDHGKLSYGFADPLTKFILVTPREPVSIDVYRHLVKMAEHMAQYLSEHHPHGVMCSP